MGRSKEFKGQVDRAESSIHLSLVRYCDTVKSAALSQAHRHDIKRRKVVKELAIAKRHYEELEKKAGVKA